MVLVASTDEQQYSLVPNVVLILQITHSITQCGKKELAVFSVVRDEYVANKVMQLCYEPSTKCTALTGIGNV